jgi:hypothetical protein
MQKNRIVTEREHILEKYLDAIKRSCVSPEYHIGTVIGVDFPL